MWFGSVVGFLALSLAPAAQPWIAPENRRAALAHYGAGTWQARHDRLIQASTSLETAAKLDPESTASLRALVPIYVDVGREKDAIRAARKVLSATPDDWETAHTLARLLHESGDPAGAAAVLKPAAEAPSLAERPDKALAIHRDLARLLELSGDRAGAEAALRKALDLLIQKRQAVLASGKLSRKDLEAETADLWERLGRSQVASRNYAAAAESFRRAHALYSDPTKAADAAGAARLDWDLARLFVAKGEPHTALANLENFLRHRPHNLAPYELLVKLLRETGRAETIVHRLREQLQKDSGNLPLKAVLAVELARVSATRTRADALFDELYKATNDPAIVRIVVRSQMETGRPERTLADIDRAYQTAEGNGQAFRLTKVQALAEVLRGEKNWAEAVLRQSANDLRAGIKRDNKTWHFLATIAERNRQLDTAAELYRSVIRAHRPDSEMEAYSRLIELLLGAHKPAEAAAACRAAMLNTEFLAPWLHYYLARALADLGEAEEALAEAETGVKQAPAGSRLDYRLNKMAVLEKLGRWGEAVALGLSLPGEFPKPAERLRIRYALSGAYWGAGKRAEAEAELRAILDEDPDNTGAANDLGYHLADLGRDLGSAEKLIRHALEVDRMERKRSGDVDEENAAYLDSLGWVLFRRGRLAEARDVLAKAVAFPEGAADPIVWDHLGDVQYRLGDKIKAKSAWQTAARLFETDPRGKREGRLEETRKKLGRAP